MLKIICFCLLVTLASYQKHTNERVFTGFFARTMMIDTSSDSCRSPAYALLYAFESDSTRGASGKLFLYGLLKCPPLFDEGLFNYSTKLKVHYRECTRADLEDVIVRNRQKFFNVRYYLVTHLEEAD